MTEHRLFQTLPHIDICGMVWTCLKHTLSTWLWSCLHLGQAWGTSGSVVTTATLQGRPQEKLRWIMPFSGLFEALGMYLYLSYEKHIVWPQESERREEKTLEAWWYLAPLVSHLNFWFPLLSLYLHFPTDLGSSRNLVCFTWETPSQQDVSPSQLCAHWLLRWLKIILTRYTHRQGPSRGQWSPTGHRLQDPFPKNKLSWPSLLNVIQSSSKRAASNVSRTFQIIIAILFLFWHH